MELKLTHMDQYKMLRDEILQHIREINQTQNAAAIAVAIFYTWLLLHKTEVETPWLWFIGPCVVAFCAFKSLDLTVRIRIVAGYLRKIEEEAFGSGARLPGWERHIAQRSLRWYDIGMVVLTAVVWIAAAVLSIAVSLHFAKDGLVGNSASVKLQAPKESHDLRK